MTDDITLFWTTDASALCDDTLFRRACALLPDFRRQAVERLKRDEDKRLCAAAWLLLQGELSVCGLSGADKAARPDEYGKPFLPERDIFFSLSHSAEMAACALARHSVGCDVEKTAAAPLSVAERFFSAPDAAALRAAQGNENQTFYTLWTKRESFIKAVGLGFRLPAERFSVSGGDSIFFPDNGKTYFFNTPAVAEDYRAAVCTADIAPCLITRPTSLASLIEILEET